MAVGGLDRAVCIRSGRTRDAVRNRVVYQLWQCQNGVEKVGRGLVVACIGRWMEVHSRDARILLDGHQSGVEKVVEPLGR